MTAPRATGCSSRSTGGPGTSPCGSRPGGAGARLSRMLEFAGNPPTWSVERLLGVKGAALLVLGLLGPAPGWRAHSGGSAGRHRRRCRRVLPARPTRLQPRAEAPGGAAAGAGRCPGHADGVRRGRAGFRRRAPAGVPVHDRTGRRGVRPRAAGGADRQASRGGVSALSQRTTVAEVKTFVTALVQADRLGLPIGAVLREQSNQMRLVRRQRADAKAQKVTVKILFPAAVASSRRS